MFTNKLKAEFKSGERSYIFICDEDSPTNEIKEVCDHILKYCNKLEDEAKEKNLESSTP